LLCCIGISRSEKINLLGTHHCVAAVRHRQKRRALIEEIVDVRPMCAASDGLVDRVG
jgi:hypothetical protein